MIATADLDGVTTLWRTSDWTSFKTLKFDARGIVSVRFSPDGLLVATANLAGVARIWDIRNGTVRTELAGHTMALTRVAFGPDGGRIATSSMDGTARLWDVTNGRELVQLKAADRLAGVAFSPNGRTLATAGFDGRAPSTYPIPNLSVAVSPDSRRIVVGTAYGGVRMIDAATSNVCLRWTSGGIPLGSPSPLTAGRSPWPTNTPRRSGRRAMEAFWSR